MLLMRRPDRPRFHGNGFTQLPLSATRRLHVWHPHLPPIPGHNATIHNHVWDMQSRVLLGTLVHRTWNVVRDYSGRCTHDIYQLGEARPDRHSGVCRLELTGEYQMAAGSVYVFGVNQWHESEAAGLTATLMEKRRSISAHPEARPLVACPHGEHPVDAFAPEHQPSEDDMWSAIDAAVRHMTADARAEIESCLG